MGTVIFAVVFLVAVAAQIETWTFRSYLFWFLIVATTMAGTTLADLLDRSLGIGYLGERWRREERTRSVRLPLAPVVTWNAAPRCHFATSSVTKYSKWMTCG